MPTPNDMLVVGRDRELARLGGLLESDRLHCGVVVTGAVGIGRTTVWEAGLAMARERGLRVLAARPAAGAAKRSFAALIDLCDGLGPSALAGLPREQRAALDVALLRAETRGESSGPRAACLGFVSLLRALAAESPLLIAIDDAQWLDAPSSHAIALAADRLRDEPVGYLLTRRAPIATALEQRGAQRIDLGPLSTAALRGLLTARHGLTLRRHLLHRVVELTQGNPSLALEMGRLLIERGLPAIGAELPVPDAIEDVSGTTVARLPEQARRLLVAVALKADLEKSDLSSIATSAAIDAAVEAGLLRVDGEQVRASHPLLALAVEQRSCASLRRAVRNALAGRDVTHVAPDPRLAATRAAQASAAAARSERLDAVHLAEQALRLTPAGSPLRGERLLALADHLALAGEPQRLRDLLTPELDSLPTGPVRARAWLLLSEPACHASRDWDQCEALLDAALAESAGDSAIRASVLLVRADRALSTLRLTDAEALARDALSAARGDEHCAARQRLAWARALRGSAVNAREGASLERVVAARLVWRGEVRRAYELLERQLAVADERGEPVAHVELRAALCDAALRAGDWSSASQLLDEWAGSSDGELLPFPIYERLRALLAAGRGLRAEAQRWATEAVGAGRARGARWDEFEALRARGTAHLLADEAAAAVACLGSVWSAVEDAGIEEPGAFPVGPELVEALLTIGDYPRARAVVDRLRRSRIVRRIPGRARRPLNATRSCGWRPARTMSTRPRSSWPRSQPTRSWVCASTPLAPPCASGARNAGTANGGQAAGRWNARRSCSTSSARRVGSSRRDPGFPASAPVSARRTTR